MATSDNADLLKLAGPRHPYQQGELGVIADLILVDGNALEDIDLIMKDGKIYKNETQ